jgi:para-nitrobenzyl esterase
LNYRLGALGFLHLPDSGLGAGNFGLLDQIAALRWVHENIAEFGGDPDQVTAAGQSAGALCALAMMSAPPSRDLFRRAILQTTPTGAPPTPAATASEVAEEFLHILGLRPDQEHRLRELPVGTLLAAQPNLARRRARPLRLEPPFQLVAVPGLVADDLRAAAASAGQAPAHQHHQRRGARRVRDPRWVGSARLIGSAGRRGAVR